MEVKAHYPAAGLTTSATSQFVLVEDIEGWTLGNLARASSLRRARTGAAGQTQKQQREQGRDDSSADAVPGSVPHVLSEEEMEKLREDNEAAIEVTIFVVETLKRTEAVNEFLVGLAIETNISEMSAERLLKHLCDPKLLEMAWTQPTVVRRIREAVRSGEAKQVNPFRDALDAATALPKGRRRRINKVQLKREFKATKSALGPVAKRLRDPKLCRNPRSYFLTLEQDENPTLACRIRLAGLVDLWFPTNRAALPELQVEKLTAWLLSLEGWAARTTVERYAKGS